MLHKSTRHTEEQTEPGDGHPARSTGRSLWAGWVSRSVLWVPFWCVAACIPANRKDDFGSIAIGGPRTVYDVHTGVVDSGDVITLSGVVAVLPRTPGDDWLAVQDPAGGEYAGLEVFLHHALTGLAIEPGDQLDVTGLLASRNGRMRLIVTDLDGIEVTGTATPTPSIVDEVADWEPYNAVVVSPGPTELLDCGELAGLIETDRGLFLDLSYASDVGVLGVGSIETGLQGVISGMEHNWSLRPRSKAELGTTPPQEGCPSTVAAARAVEHVGRLVLPEVVVTGLQAGGSRAFVQDVDGGPGSGLELWSDGSALTDLTVGETASFMGMLDRLDGPLVLRVDAHQPAAEAVALSTDVPTDLWDSAWDGALVEAGVLEITGTSSPGRRSTAEGVELVDVLLDGPELPESGSWSMTGLLRVDPRTDPSRVQLLPRAATDWFEED